MPARATTWLRLVSLFFSVSLVVTAAIAQSRLRIVVIEGEDAVNIIQQRTAVAPVVEVRDANNQPVSGASVVFNIRSGGANFNGNRSLNATTNAAGRAVATGFTATAPGTVQVVATASFQGQTAAITISSTNALAAGGASAAGGSVAAGGVGAGTAAVAAGTAAAAGGAAATGGGLSALTIGAIAGGAAGGLYAAKATGLLFKEPCVFVVSPTSFNVPSQGNRALSGTTLVDVSFENDGCGPTNWEATSHDPFLHFGTPTDTNTSRVSVKGEGSVFFNVVESAPGTPSRTGTMTIAGHTVTVNQAGRCLYTITPTSLTFPSGGGSAAITVNVTPPLCDSDTWTVDTISNFLTLSTSAGKGTGVVMVTATANPFAFGQRTGIISIGPSFDIGRVLIPFVQ